MTDVFRDVSNAFELPRRGHRAGIDRRQLEAAARFGEMMVQTANEELRIRDQLEENLRQRLEAERMRAEKAERKLFWKQLERFMQGAAVGKLVKVFAR